MLNSQICILAQAQSYLHTTSEAQYTQVINPQFVSSAGAHMRHILDHYRAIMAAMSTGLIDYDQRNRGGHVETSINAALTSITEINAFLSSLTPLQLQQSMQLSTEISVQEKLVVIVNTSLGREIIFAGSHAIHHFAMIKQIANAQLAEIPAQFGIAPATATFLRGNICLNTMSE